jgi:hypothetical protein
MTIPRKKPNLDPSRFRRKWGCPMTKNRTPWCFALCTPVRGTGFCGRVAPHSLMGRTDRALRNYRDRQKAKRDDEQSTP